MESIALLNCFRPYVAAATLRQFSMMVMALLTMTGRVTMRGLARWTDKGGSYRTVQRFFATEWPWTQRLVKFFATHLCQCEHEFIRAGAATTVTKAGAQTHGVGRFFQDF